jgi:hypothetical protein
MKLGALLDHLHLLERALAAELRTAADRHRDDQDVHHQCRTLAVAADQRAERCSPHAERLGGTAEWESAVHGGSDDLLESLRALYLATEECTVTWTMVIQAAQATRDAELLAVARECAAQAERHAKWFVTRIKVGAPQALVVA